MDQSKKKLDVLKPYGYALRVLRQKKQLSQEALSEKLGCSVRHIQRIESGISEPGIVIVSKWIDATCRFNLLNFFEKLVQLPQFLMDKKNDDKS